MACAIQRSVTLVLLCAVSLASAQITFSRDWTGGKRSPQLPHDCDQFARLCRHFVHEIRHSLTRHSSERHEAPPDDPLPNYDDDK